MASCFCSCWFFSGQCFLVRSCRSCETCFLIFCRNILLPNRFFGVDIFHCGALTPVVENHSRPILKRQRFIHFTPYSIFSPSRLRYASTAGCTFGLRAPACSRSRVTGDWILHQRWSQL